MSESPAEERRQESTRRRRISPDPPTCAPLIEEGGEEGSIISLPAQTLPAQTSFQKETADSPLLGEMSGQRSASRSPSPEHPDEGVESNRSAFSARPPSPEQLEVSMSAEEKGQGDAESLLLNLPVEIIVAIVEHCQSPLDYFRFAATCRTLRLIVGSSIRLLHREKRYEVYNGIVSSLRHRFGAVFPHCCYSVMRYRKLGKRIWEEIEQDSDLLPLWRLERFNRDQFLETPIPEGNWGKRLSAPDFYLMSRILDQAEIVVKELSTKAFNMSGA
ncbi:hypothetical protein FPOAC2_09905 [Fusarium poae]|uniref:hypothetical protein n=1 Tax=Fusarium poae TaxID=36050 RepID=UPI001CE861E4|nr:hypothetical protein FPOAC1_009964 [Fusarium poae]KAG8670542.1 hypothetical protein FPOAC1_009964 [Fusarium poae]